MCTTAIDSYPVIDREQTGKTIRALREKSGISRDKLSQLLGLTTSRAIYDWENGKTIPSIDNLLALAKIFRTPVDSIIKTESQETGSVGSLGSDSHEPNEITHMAMETAENGEDICGPFNNIADLMDSLDSTAIG